MSYYSFQPCYRCSGMAQPGTTAIMKYVLRKFPYTTSMGIYSCRSVFGGSQRSIHSCGRALDIGVPLLANGAANVTLGNPVVRFIDKYSTQFGIMGMIYNRIRYDKEDPRGALYTGAHPHRDHIHVEQIASKAASLTYSQIVSIAGSPTGTAPAPLPPPTTTPVKGGTLLPIKNGSSPEDIRLLQDHLNYQVTGTETPLKVDGVYSTSTVAMVKKKVGSLGVTDAQKNGLEVGYRQWNYIEIVFMKAHL